MQSEKTLIGWREWLALPELGIDQIKAKIDTGARTSALHAFYIEAYKDCGRAMVRFDIHAQQRSTNDVVNCAAEVIDEREVSDSGGHRERRFVIASKIVMGGMAWTSEITLTNRDTMLFRMLLGRTALQGRFLIDPSQSYLMGQSLADSQKKFVESKRKRKITHRIG